jgi:hypothetical protein
MTEILALDIATVCGFARGRVGSTPVSGSIRFGRRDASDNAIFGHAIEWMETAFITAPDVLVLEAMLPPGAKVGATQTDVRDRLAGLHGIARGQAHLAGVYKIQAHPVASIRGHFIGMRGLKRKEAKGQIVARCRQLGWDVVDDNAADACALWHYACSLIDPTQVLRVSPLFNRKLRVHVQ